MNNMIKTIDSTNLKAGMYVLCTQDNGNQFIGKVSKVEGDRIYFEYVLKDNGTKTEKCSGNIKDFEITDCSYFKDLIDSLDSELFKDENTQCVKETISDDKVKTPFVYTSWSDNRSNLVTRDGRTVRIVAIDVKGNYPILALVSSDNIELPICYTFNGTAGIPGDKKSFNQIGFNDLDLFMVEDKPTPTIQYARVYRRDNTGTTFMSQLVNDPKEFDSIDIPTGCSVVKIIPVEF